MKISAKTHDYTVPETLSFCAASRRRWKDHHRRHQHRRLDCIPRPEHVLDDNVAIASMIRGGVIDLASRAITVNNVQPGPTATDMTVGNAETFIPLIPLGRVGEPEETGGLSPRG
jgi:hypothetical protein